MAFEKKARAPLVVVTDKEKENNTDFGRPGNASDLIKTLSETESGKQNAAEINKIVTSIKYQPFGNDEELIDGLNRAAIRCKEAKVKALQVQLLAAHKIKGDLDEYKKAADSELGRIQRNNNNSLVVTVESLLKWVKENDRYRGANNVSATESLTVALNDELKKNSDASFDFTDLKKRVRTFYSDQRDEGDKRISKIEEAIWDTDTEYEPIVKNIYTTLKVKPTVEGLFPAQNSGILSRNIFDTKNNLHVIYKLIEITLKVIIIFGLLYIILIPLRHIFFIATSGETLADQAKKLAESKSATPSTLGNVLLVTATTIGIGASVVAGYAFSGGVSEYPEDEHPPRVTKTPGTSGPGTGGGPGGSGDSDATQLNIDQLTIGINNVNSSVSNLQKVVDETLITEIKNTKEKVEAVNTTVTTTSDTVGVRNPVTDGTMLQKVDAFSTESRQRHKDVLLELEAIKKSITDPANPGNQTTLTATLDRIEKILNGAAGIPSEKDAIIKRLENISAAIGQDEILGQVNTADPDQARNLNDAIKRIRQRIGKPNDLLSAANPNQPVITSPPSISADTLFGKINNVSRSIGTDNYNRNNTTIFDALGTNVDDMRKPTVVGFVKLISANTTELGKIIIGESGSMSTLIKTLGSDTQYSINRLVTMELATRKRDLFSSEAIREFINNAQSVEDKESIEKLYVQKNNDISIFNKRLDNLIAALESIGHLKEEKDGSGKTVRPANHNFSITEEKLIEELKKENFDQNNLGKDIWNIIFQYPVANIH